MDISSRSGFSAFSERIILPLREASSALPPVHGARNYSSYVQKGRSRTAGPVSKRNKLAKYRRALETRAAERSELRAQSSGCPYAETLSLAPKRQQQDLFPLPRVPIRWDYEGAIRWAEHEEVIFHDTGMSSPSTPPQMAALPTVTQGSLGSFASSQLEPLQNTPQPQLSWNQAPGPPLTTDPSSRSARFSPLAPILSSPSPREKTTIPVTRVDLPQALEIWAEAVCKRFPEAPGDAQAAADWLQHSMGANGGALRSLAELDSACLDVGIDEDDVSGVSASLWEGLSVHGQLPVSKLLQVLEDRAADEPALPTAHSQLEAAISPPDDSAVPFPSSLLQSKGAQVQRSPEEEKAAPLAVQAVAEGPRPPAGPKPSSKRPGRNGGIGARESEQGEEFRVPELARVSAPEQAVSSPKVSPKSRNKPAAFPDIPQELPSDILLSPRPRGQLGAGQLAVMESEAEQMDASSTARLMSLACTAVIAINVRALNNVMTIQGSWPRGMLRAECEFSIRNCRSAGIYIERVCVRAAWHSELRRAMRSVAEVEEYTIQEKEEVQPKRDSQLEVGAAQLDDRDLGIAEDEETASAVTKIQAKYRQKQAAADVAIKRQEKHELEVGTTKIQAAFRGRQARKTLTADKIEHISVSSVQDGASADADDQTAHVDAATKIQSRFRQSRASVEVKAMRQERSEMEAGATKIQAVFRGQQTRKELQVGSELPNEADAEEQRADSAPQQGSAQSVFATDLLANQAFTGVAHQHELHVGETMVALYDYAALDMDELSFREGDTMVIIQTDERDPGWYVASMRGREGLIPGNYVQQLQVFGTPSRGGTPENSDSKVPLKLLFQSVSAFGGFRGGFHSAMASARDAAGSSSSSSSTAPLSQSPPVGTLSSKPILPAELEASAAQASIPGRVPLAVLFASTAATKARLAKERLAKEKAREAAAGLGTIEENANATVSAAASKLEILSKVQARRKQEDTNAKVSLTKLFSSAAKMKVAAQGARQRVAERASSSSAIPEQEAPPAFQGVLEALKASSEKSRGSTELPAPPTASSNASAKVTPGRVPLAVLFSTTAAAAVRKSEAGQKRFHSNSSQNAERLSQALPS